MTRDQRTSQSLVERATNLLEDIGYFKAEQDLSAEFDRLNQAEDFMAEVLKMLLLVKIANDELYGPY